MQPLLQSDQRGLPEQGQLQDSQTAQETSGQPAQGRDGQLAQAEDSQPTLVAAGHTACVIRTAAARAGCTSSASLEHGQTSEAVQPPEHVETNQTGLAAQEQTVPQCRPLQTLFKTDSAQEPVQPTSAHAVLDTNQQEQHAAAAHMPPSMLQNVDTDGAVPSDGSELFRVYPGLESKQSHWPQQHQPADQCALVPAVSQLSLTCEQYLSSNQPDCNEWQPSHCREQPHVISGQLNTTNKLPRPNSGPLNSFELQSVLLLQQSFRLTPPRQEDLGSEGLKPDLVPASLGLTSMLDALDACGSLDLQPDIQQPSLSPFQLAEASSRHVSAALQLHPDPEQPGSSIAQSESGRLLACGRPHLVSFQYPGIEGSDSSRFQSAGAMSRCVSKQLQSHPGSEQSHASEDPDRQLLSWNLSFLLSVYPGLEKPDSDQQVESSISRAMSALLQLHPGLEQPDMDKSQHAQDQPCCMLQLPGSGLSLYPGLEPARLTTALQSPAELPLQSVDTVSQTLCGHSQNRSSGLEQAVSNSSQLAQRDQTGLQPQQYIDSALDDDSSKLYPGLEQMESNRAQETQQSNFMLRQHDTAGILLAANSGSVKVYPGFEQMLSHGALQPQHDSKQQLQPISLSTFRSGLEQLYPGLEQILSNWALQPQPDQRELQQQLQPISLSISRSDSEQLYPGLEQVVSDWALQPQPDQRESQQQLHPISLSSSRSGLEQLYPGLEQAVSDWALQPQHDQRKSQQHLQPVSLSSSKSGLEHMYPGREQVSLDRLVQQDQVEMLHRSEDHLVMAGHANSSQVSHICK